MQKCRKKNCFYIQTGGEVVITNILLWTFSNITSSTFNIQPIRSSIQVQNGSRSAQQNMQACLIYPYRFQVFWNVLLWIITGVIDIDILLSPKNKVRIMIKQARNPGTVQTRIANSDGRTDGLTKMDLQIRETFLKSGKLKLCIFKDHSIIGPSQSVSL